MSRRRKLNAEQHKLLAERHLLYTRLRVEAAKHSPHQLCKEFGISLATLLTSTHPVWTTLLTWRFLGEPTDRRRVLAVAAALVGCALIARVYDPGGLRANLLGIAFGLASDHVAARTLLAVAGGMVLAYAGLWWLATRRLRRPAPSEIPVEES